MVHAAILRRELELIKNNVSIAASEIRKGLERILSEDTADTPPKKYFSERVGV